MSFRETIRRKYRRLPWLVKRDRSRVKLPLVRDGITYRLLDSNDSIEELTSLIRKAYSVHSKAGIHKSTIKQSNLETIKRIRHAYTILAIENDRMIGSFSYKPPWECRGTPWFNMPGVAKTNMEAIDPERQGQGIASVLSEIVELMAYLHGAEELACDIAEKNTKQINIKTKRDYRFISYHSWKFNNYRSVIMSKKLDMQESK